MMVLSQDVVKEIFNSLLPIYSHSSESHENLTAISLQGLLNFKGAKQKVKNFYSKCLELNLCNMITVRVDDEPLFKSNYEDLISEADEFSSWKINITNTELFQDEEKKCQIHIFLNLKAVKKHFQDLNPLDYNFSFEVGKKYKILIPDLSTPLVSNKLIISGVEDFLVQHDGEQISIDVKKMLDNIQFSPESKLFLTPEFFNYTNCPKELKVIFNRHLALQYTLSIVNKIVSENEICLIGRVQKNLQLTNNSESITVDKLESIKSLSEWVYEALVPTKQRLVADIVLLNLRDGETLLSCLLRESKQCLTNAIDQFNYVLSDRRHDYFKELTAINSELSKQSDHYGAKIRSLITSISRDFLASIFLMGVTIPIRLSRIQTDDKVSSDNFLLYLIKVIGAYLIVSLILQSVTTIPDIVKSKKQIESWVNRTRLYLVISDFDNHFKKPLNKKTNHFYIQYIIVSALYLILGIYFITSPNSVLGLW